MTPRTYERTLSNQNSNHLVRTIHSLYLITTAVSTYSFGKIARKRILIRKRSFDRVIALVYRTCAYRLCSFYSDKKKCITKIKTVFAIRVFICMQPFARPGTITFSIVNKNEEARISKRLPKRDETTIITVLYKYIRA